MKVKAIINKETGKKKKVQGLFFIEVTNDSGKGFYCALPEGPAFANKFCAQVKLFHSHTSAKMRSKDFEKLGYKTKVIPMANILNNPDLCKEYGITMASNSTKQLYKIVGYTDDGTKYWIHFDTENKKYFPFNKEEGSCICDEEKLASEWISVLEADSTIIPRLKYTIEKMKPNAQLDIN